VIGVDHSDDRNPELARLADRDLLVADVDHEQGIRQAVHVLDATEALLELVAFAPQPQLLFLVEALDATILLHRLEVLEALDRLLDGLEVGQHAAQPTEVDEGHVATLGLTLDVLAGVALGANQQDLAALGGEAAEVIHRVVEERLRLLEVDDVDVVARAEDVRGHLRVPVAGLVAKVDTGLQHLAHGNASHDLLLQVRVDPPCTPCENLLLAGTPSHVSVHV